MSFPISEHDINFNSKTEQFKQAMEYNKKCGHYMIYPCGCDECLALRPPNLLQRLKRLFKWKK